jgi:hypothetical protein
VEVNAFPDRQRLQGNEEYGDGQGIHLLNKEKAYVHFILFAHVIMFLESYVFMVQWSI